MCERGREREKREGRCGRMLGCWTNRDEMKTKVSALMFNPQLNLMQHGSYPVLRKSFTGGVQLS